MAGANELFGSLPLLPEVTWWVLVPNRKGAELARSAGATHLTVTVSASTAYSEKNVGVPTGAAIAGLVTITEAADDAELDVVVSCAFGSPFADVLSAGHVGSVLTAVLEKTPSARLTLADTTGMATPPVVTRTVEAIRARFPEAIIALHFHNTRGIGLANVMNGLALGVREYESSFGGLGGCPFAGPGAAGRSSPEPVAEIPLLAASGPWPTPDRPQVLSEIVGSRLFRGRGWP
jgi:hydroxymethylglutaryl-CoA lyase